MCEICDALSAINAIMSELNLNRPSTFGTVSVLKMT